MPPTKRKSNYDLSDPFVTSDPDSPPPTTNNTNTRPSKRSKPSSSTPQIPTQQTDPDGNPYWQLSTARRATVSDFRGKKMISIREYYEKDGVWLPGKKGITMTLDQYAELLKVVPQIERALGRDGEKVGRPNYSDTANGDVKREDEGSGEDDDDGADGSARKANIEATSDEDEG